MSLSDNEDHVPKIFPRILVSELGLILVQFIYIRHLLSFNRQSTSQQLTYCVTAREESHGTMNSED